MEHLSHVGAQNYTLEMFWGAHPRPPDPPSYVGELRPHTPGPPLMSASGLPIYQLFNRIPIKYPINKEA